MTEWKRSTKETEIDVTLGGPAAVATPLPMLTHLVQALGRYADVPIRLRAVSRDGLEHHLIEDVAIALGAAFRARYGERNLQRFGQRLLPMDDALVAVAVDVGGRPYYAGDLPEAMWTHFLRSLAFEARWTLHVEVRRPGEVHHTVEATFKALGLALREALVPAERIVSTKGKVRARGG